MFFCFNYCKISIFFRYLPLICFKNYQLFSFVFLICLRSWLMHLTSSSRFLSMYIFVLYANLQHRLFFCFTISPFLFLLPFFLLASHVLLAVYGFWMWSCFGRLVPVVPTLTAHKPCIFDVFLALPICNSDRFCCFYCVACFFSSFSYPLSFLMNNSLSIIYSTLYILKVKNFVCTSTSVNMNNWKSNLTVFNSGNP